MIGRRKAPPPSLSWNPAVPLPQVSARNNYPGINYVSPSRPESRPHRSQSLHPSPRALSAHPEAPSCLRLNPSKHHRSTKTRHIHSPRTVTIPARGKFSWSNLYTPTLPRRRTRRISLDEDPENSTTKKYESDGCFWEARNNLGFTQRATLFHTTPGSPALADLETSTRLRHFHKT